MSYKIAGMAIKNEYLALGTILSTIALASSQMGGSKKEASGSTPVDHQPIPASSKDEENFIAQFLEDHESKDKH